MERVVAFASGLLFAVGLGVAGMTKPSKVIGFLDFFGDWDPSLMLVMVGAIGVNAVVYQLVKRRTAPIAAPKFQIPTRADIDKRLVIGAALFGAGWGLGGFCPGPGIVSLATLTGPVAIFVGAMLLGMALYKVVDEKVLSKS